MKLVVVIIKLNNLIKDFDKLSNLELIVLKKVFPIQNRINEHQHRIPHICVSLCTKYKMSLQKAILNFQTKFSQKGYFRSNAGKMNITTGFCIFKLA